MNSSPFSPVPRASVTTNATCLRGVPFANFPGATNGTGDYCVIETSNNSSRVLEDCLGPNRTSSVVSFVSPKAPNCTYEYANMTEAADTDGITDCLLKESCVLWGCYGGSRYDNQTRLSGGVRSVGKPVLVTGALLFFGSVVGGEGLW